MKTIQIAGRIVGAGQPCFIIAEAGVNHNGRMDLALQLVDAAAESGADAVKFQTFKAESVMSPSAPKAAYQKVTTAAQESQLDMVRALELPQEAFREIRERCRQRRIMFLSTPFDLHSMDFLCELGVPALKIPSGEITNHPFLKHAAGKGLPLIVSTGMSTLAEVQEAMGVLRLGGATEIALLHCVSNYPARIEDANLRVMQTLSGALSCPVGFSDHTQGIFLGPVAVALGACIVEKHLTLDNDLPGPDHRASIEPAQLAALIRSIRAAESALGDGVKKPAAAEKDTADVARRSLFAAVDLHAGDALREDMVAILRPGTGLSPARMGELLGRRLRVAVKVGTMLNMEMFY